MLAILTFAPAALAEPSATEDAPAVRDARGAESQVRHALLEPLAAKEDKQGRFSRARMPAQERRVRILDEKPGTDRDGGAFYRFAVDARHGVRPVESDEGWRTATITGCVYVDSGAVFVKVGERHRPGAFLLGKNLKPVAEATCKAAAEVALRD